MSCGGAFTGLFLPGGPGGGGALLLQLIAVFPGVHFLFHGVVAAVCLLLFHSLGFADQSAVVLAPIFLAAVSAPWFGALVPVWLF